MFSVPLRLPGRGGTENVLSGLSRPDPVVLRKAFPAVLKIFGWSYGVTVVSLVVAVLYGGWTALFLCVILGILEVSLSFDNAVVNATILQRMSEFWQKIFLTVGIVIAVFGMRLGLPAADRRRSPPTSGRSKRSSWRWSSGRSRTRPATPRC